MKSLQLPAVLLLGIIMGSAFVEQARASQIASIATSPTAFQSSLTLIKNDVVLTDNWVLSQLSINSSGTVAWGEAFPGRIRTSDGTTTTTILNAGTGNNQIANYFAGFIDDTGAVTCQGTYTTGNSATRYSGGAPVVLADGLQLSGIVKGSGTSVSVYYPIFVPGKDGGNPDTPYRGAVAYGPANSTANYGFLGYYTGQGATQGIYRGTGNEAATVTIADNRPGSQFQGNLEGKTFFGSTFSAGGVNNANQVLFRGNLNSSPLQEGLYVGSGGALTQIRTTLDGTFKGFGDYAIGNSTDSAGVGAAKAMSINDAGDVAYRAVRADGSEALYFFNHATGLSTLLYDGTNRPLNKIYSVSLNNDDVIAMVAGNSTKSALFTLYDGGIRKIVGTDDMVNVPGQGQIPVLRHIHAGDYALNDNNQLALFLGFNASSQDPRYSGVLYRVDLSTQIFRAGDADQDGVVGGSDYSIWLNNFGSSGTNWAHGDFDADGVVGGSDYTTWLNHFGASQSGGAVPEPATMCLLLLGGLGVLGRRRRK